MSVPLRYQSPDLVEHLARGYVLGNQSARVRRRCRTLSRQLPALASAIVLWQERLQPLAEGEAVSPSAAVWAGIEQRLWGEPLRRQLRLWRTLTGLAASLLLALTVWLWQAPTLPPVPHYVAALGGPAEPVQWVVNVTRLAPGQVRLGIDGKAWPGQPMALWARTGSGWVMLGNPGRDNREWPLDKVRWLAVTEAEQLVLTADPDSPPGEPEGWLSAGPCLQLRNWL